MRWVRANFRKTMRAVSELKKRIIVTVHGKPTVELIPVPPDDSEDDRDDS